MGIVPNTTGNNLSLLIDFCCVWSRSCSRRKKTFGPKNCKSWGAGEICTSHQV